MDDPLVLVSGDRTRTAVRVGTYADLRPGQIGLVTDSYGLVSIALDRRSAAEELRIHSGEGVTIRPAE
jgi:S-adenosylmethionine hydrolase